MSSAKTRNRHRRKALLRAQLNKEAQWSLSIAVAQTQKKLDHLELEMGFLRKVNERLTQNWLEAQERINLLTDHYNGLALAASQEGVWNN